MTSLCLYVDVIRGERLYETVEIREYKDRPGYVPEIGDYIVIGNMTYHVVNRRVAFTELPDGPDCFLTLYVKEVQESLMKRLWGRLRGRNKTLRMEK